MANAGINLHLAEIEVDETLVKYITPASQRGTLVITAVRSSSLLFISPVLAALS